MLGLQGSSILAMVPALIVPEAAIGNEESNTTPVISWSNTRTLCRFTKAYYHQLRSNSLVNRVSGRSYGPPRDGLTARSEPETGQDYS